MSPAVWEKVVVAQKWERSLIAQTCGLLRSLRTRRHASRPSTRLYFLECGVDLPEHSVTDTVEMQGLLAVTMNQGLTPYALHGRFGEMRIL